MIQGWPENINSLSPFANLEIIRGRTKRYVPHRDPVFTHLINSFFIFLYFLLCSGRSSLALTTLSITSLGLRSLREISDGDVVIMKNKNLCYTSNSHWKKLFKSEGQSVMIEGNVDAATCGQSNFNPLRTFLKVSPATTTFTALRQRLVHESW